MSTESQPMEVKCENMMNIVVETRKRFRELCVDYDQKSSYVENRLLKLQMDIVSELNIRPKNLCDSTSNSDDEDFCLEMAKQSARLEKLKKNLKNTLDVVNQLKKDRIGETVRQPIDATNMLQTAKQKAGKCEIVTK